MFKLYTFTWHVKPKPNMPMMINRWATDTCSCHVDKSSIWPFEVGTFTILRDASCSRVHGGMLLAQVVRVA